MRSLVKLTCGRVKALWRCFDHHARMAGTIAFVIWAVHTMYEFASAQLEFGFMTAVSLVGLFWVLLAVFVLHVDGMEMLDRIVDWFQTDPGDPKTAGDKP